MEHISCDVLVLGSGSAGLRAAISARQSGLDVCILSKGNPGKATCTGFSAGVMAGSSGPRSAADHLERTVLAGRGINQRELVEVLIEEAPIRLDELIRWGIRGELVDGFLFSKGRPPVMGEEIIDCLIRKNRELGTRFIGNFLVTDMVVEEGAAGLIGYRQASNEWLAFTADSVVLATGGAAALYLRHDNPQGMLGEGCRLALDVGAILQDMEFVQFYPVCLAEPGHAPLVIPPRLADCGRLISATGKDILQEYGIEERPAAESARDKLSQALFQEIFRHGQPVLLDIRGLSEEKWNIDPFASSMRRILEQKYEARHRPLRVAPAAHHTMGGVVIDVGGATSVPGLFAAGEVTGGLHGANRLGGNALSETLVFGARAGESAAEWARRGTDEDPQSILKLLNSRLLLRKRPRPAGAELLKKLRKTMWDYGGIMRDREKLTFALDNIKEMLEIYESSSDRKSIDPGHGFEFLPAARVAQLILEGALRRLETRGAHFREDYPTQNDEQWLGHLQVRAAPDGNNSWEFKPRAGTGYK